MSASVIYEPYSKPSVMVVGGGLLLCISGPLNTIISIIEKFKKFLFKKKNQFNGLNGKICCLA